MEWVIGIDLGGTQLRVALIDRRGQIAAHERQPSQAGQGPEVTLARMAAVVEQLRAGLPAGDSLLGIGVGAPGPLDPQSGMILSAPNLPGWRQVPLRDLLAQQTGLPVVLANDANAAALGEWRFGGGIGLRHLVYVTVSTGIGGGVIVDGQLLLGRQGVGAEVGLMIIDAGSAQFWENLASGTALSLAAAALMRAQPATLLHSFATPERITAEHVAAAAARGDAAAIALMQREAELLGLGFVNLLHLYSPELILVGGSVVIANPALLDHARATVQRFVADDVYRDVPIEVARLGDRSGLLGAAALAFDAHTPS